ncbi:F0F1 ATP synthase subunit delta [Candidatus Uhrbacteria bacterium]|nr:F0F1 ATP synthase subunit delta [Candidatus Uhrbacteria bacterium]
MKTNIETYAELLVSASLDVAGSKLDDRVKEVLNLMDSRGDAHLIKRLESAVSGAYNKLVAGSDIQVTTAGDPEALKVQVAKLLKCHEEDIVAMQDQELIGGAVVKVDNTIIDASVSGSLRRLATHLK